MFVSPNEPNFRAPGQLRDMNRALSAGFVIFVTPTPKTYPPTDQQHPPSPPRKPPTRLLPWNREQRRAWKGRAAYPGAGGNALWLRRHEP